MKFYTKIEWILDDDSLAKSSAQVKSAIEKCKNAKGDEFTRNDVEKIIKNQIEKKIKSPRKIKGVCDCQSGILCEHRKAYIKEAMNE